MLSRVDYLRKLLRYLYVVSLYQLFMMLAQIKVIVSSSPLIAFDVSRLKPEYLGFMILGSGFRTGGF